MKKLFLIAAIAAALSPTTTWADEWTDPETNVVYTYTPGQSEASVKAGTYSKAGSPNAKGDIAILDKITVRGSEYAVTSIGSFAFCNCSGLTSVTIPSSVTSIENNAFRGCSGLSSVTIPNSVTNFGNLAFYECSGLTSVTIPNSVTSIGKEAFYDCSSLSSVTIPNSVTTIGDFVFNNCSSLFSITIPESVTTIGYKPYHGTGWYNVQPDGILYLDNWLLGYKGNEPTGEITINNGTKGIAQSAFQDCNGLTYVTIPESVTFIGDYAFMYCSGLTSVTIPNSVTSIGDLAFTDCSGLTSITIPNSVTSIGEYNQEIKGETNVEIISVIA